MLGTILIVEDDKLNMKLFRDLLQAKGYATIQTGEGRRALGLVCERFPDLIIMDIQLPDISGLDVIRALKKDDELKDIPVIAITALVHEATEKICREAGCDGYMAKPIFIREFIQTIDMFLNFSGKQTTVSMN